MRKPLANLAVKYGNTQIHGPWGKNHKGSNRGTPSKIGQKTDMQTALASN